MRRSSLNFIVDLVGFVVLLGMVITGLIMMYVLPPGTGCGGQGWRGGRGEEAARTLLSLGRHDWGKIHYVLALLFIVLMTAHILLHWEWIKNYFKSLTGPSGRS